LQNYLDILVCKDKRFYLINNNLSKIFSFFLTFLLVFPLYQTKKVQEFAKKRQLLYKLHLHLSKEKRDEGVALKTIGHNAPNI